MNQQQRLERAEAEIGRAIMTVGDERSKRNRVLIALRHLIAWVSEGATESDDLDPDIESSRHG